MTEGCKVKCGYEAWEEHNCEVYKEEKGEDEKDAEETRKGRQQKKILAHNGTVCCSEYFRPSFFITT